MSSASSGWLVAASVAFGVVPIATVARLDYGSAHAVTHLSAPSTTVQEIAPDPSTLRVCADPNNLPFSTASGDGFENAIATLVAHDLGKTVGYYWLPQRRGFVRNSLRAGLCDVIVGVPADYELVRTTRPYYRSSYAFVFRAGRHRLDSFDDPALRRLTIGVQVTGDDYQNPPPALALAARQLANNVRGYTVYGDYSQPDPQRQIIDDVSAGRLDAAVVWGPIAGYFARQHGAQLAIVPVREPRDRAAGALAFDIAMGVRRDDATLQRQLDDVLSRRAGEIRRILSRFGVPIAGSPRAREDAPTPAARSSVTGR